MSPRFNAEKTISGNFSANLLDADASHTYSRDLHMTNDSVNRNPMEVSSETYVYDEMGLKDDNHEVQAVDKKTL